MDSCVNIFQTMTPCLVEGGMTPGTARLIVITINVLFFAIFPLLLGILVIWIERKFSARMQDRLGPNRVGTFGLLQNIADAIKLIGKEDITPQNADKVVYNIAPILMLASVVLIWSALPFSAWHVGSDLEIGILYIIAVSSLGTLGIIMAGWSSNNKYALLGAFRTVAQLISYEVPLVLSVLVPVMLTGSMNMQELARAQSGMWYLVIAPLSAILFFIANQAEVGRPPFDLIEAESELVAGYNIEYTGMKFGLFMVGEFLHGFTVTVLFAVVFMGGWTGPGAETFVPLGFVYLTLKTLLAYTLMMTIRFSVPRIRIDQLMNLNWKFMVPVSILNLVIIAFTVKVLQLTGWMPTPGAGFVAMLPATTILLIVNLVMILGIIRVVGSNARRSIERTTDDLQLINETALK